jgi:hypothetical protein
MHGMAVHHSLPENLEGEARTPSLSKAPSLARHRSLVLTEKWGRANPFQGLAVKKFHIEAAGKNASTAWLIPTNEVPLQRLAAGMPLLLIPG